MKKPWGWTGGRGKFQAVLMVVAGEIRRVAWAMVMIIQHGRGKPLEMGKEGNEDHCAGAGGLARERFIASRRTLRWSRLGAGRSQPASGPS
jgi:hypothetical protein